MKWNVGLFKNFCKMKLTNRSPCSGINFKIIKERMVE